MKAEPSEPYAPTFETTSTRARRPTIRQNKTEPYNYEDLCNMPEKVKQHLSLEMGSE